MKKPTINDQRVYTISNALFDLMRGQITDEEFIRLVAYSITEDDETAQSELDRGLRTYCGYAQEQINEENQYA